MLPDNLNVKNRKKTNQTPNLRHVLFPAFVNIHFTNDFVHLLFRKYRNLKVVNVVVNQSPAIDP